MESVSFGDAAGPSPRSTHHLKKHSGDMEGKLVATQTHASNYHFAAITAATIQQGNSSNRRQIGKPAQHDSVCNFDGGVYQTSEVAAK